MSYCNPKWCELCGQQSMPPEQSKCTCTHDDGLFTPAKIQPDSEANARRFRFLAERFASTKTSASQRVLEALGFSEDADPCDGFADLVDAEMNRGGS